MNRQTFIKRIGGAIAGIAGFCLLPKKKDNNDIFKIDDKPFETLRNYKSIEFYGRQFKAKDNRIWWSEVGNYKSWPEMNFVYLPTYDTVKKLVVAEDRLYLYGFHETWEIIPTEDAMQFNFQLKGYVV